jgi:iron complex outermembrane receptor protein
MKASLFAVALFIFLSPELLGQDQQESDTTRVLEEVTVKAYQYDRPLQLVPASVGYVSQKELERFNNASLLPVVNTIPGVRMEERSPGSYRFSIRGSLLRSPFGIRNVKMYWKGLPLTDAGGNTYLNLVDFSSVGSVEVIKGPGGSLYGAGTGGIVLLETPRVKGRGGDVSTTLGSFGLQRYQLSLYTQTSKLYVRSQYVHQQSNGYREQSAMRRDAANVDLQYQANERGILGLSVFYSDLYYQTPGGLTKAQFDENPKRARPATATLPGAVDQKAAVYNKTVYSGLWYDYQWSKAFSTRAGLSGAYTDFANPAILNFEKRKESNAGGRVENQFAKEYTQFRFKFIFGGEYQYFYSPVHVYNNIQGIAGSNTSANDRLHANQLLIFAQTDFDLPLDVHLTLGGSYNFLKYHFIRYAPDGSDLTRKFDPVFSPRVALLKRFSSSLSLYGNISRGFSPPSLAEVRPSTSNFNNTLNAERGTSYELGIRGSWKKKIFFDINAYYFQLNQTIVIQRAENGAEFFVNAGRTNQKGIESVLSFTPWLEPRNAFVSTWKIWNSLTFNHYRFAEYIQDNVDYSGHKLTGVAPVVNVSGIDINLQNGGYANLTSNYTGSIPLNDANTQSANSYFLLGGRAGFRKSLSQSFTIDIFFGVDNALNRRYSLGNDLNAAGGRFYNAAATRNYYGGLKLSFNKKPS